MRLIHPGPRLRMHALKKRCIQSLSRRMAASGNEKSAIAQEFGSKLGTAIVDILVGPNRELFRVHKDRLCTRAPVFDRMFNGGFKEATDQLAELPEDDPVAFNAFLEWLYTSRLTQPGPFEGDSKYKWAWSYLKVYCFAEKYCLSELMNQAMSVLMINMRQNNQQPDLEEIEYVYAHSSSNSHLRRFMALFFQFRILKHQDSGLSGNEAIYDLMLTCRELTLDYLALSKECDSSSLENPSHLDPCNFHIHGAGRECTVKNDPTFPQWKGPSI